MSKENLIKFYDWMTQLSDDFYFVDFSLDEDIDAVLHGYGYI